MSISLPRFSKTSSEEFLEMSMDATRNFVNGCEFLKGHIFRRWFMTELNQNGVAIPNIKTPRYYCNEHMF
jgi:hypothetical protein